MVQTVCLDENEHAVSMLRGLNQMKHEHDLCDFTIEVQDVEYQVHKNILSVGSPYFKAMLKHGTKESRDGKVEMKSVDPECVKSCIDFLYSGRIDIPDGKVGPLLQVAIILQLEKVKDAISDFVIKSLSAENFHETRLVAKMYELEHISKKCKIYYQENLMAISSQPGFEKEEKFDLINALKSRNLNLSEDEKLTVSLRWIGKNWDKKETLIELIKLIKLKDVPTEYLGDILEKHRFISNDIRLYKFINAAYVEKLKKDDGKSNIESDNQIVILDGAADRSENNETATDNNRDLIGFFDLGADCLRSYDPATDEVTTFHDEKFKHLMHFSTVSMDSYIYVLCGNKSVHRLNFRDKNSKWERMRDMIGRHGSYPSAVSLSGSLFVIGGSDLFSLTNNGERFDPAANRWSRLKDKPKAVYRVALVSLNDSIFCIGGSDGCGDLNTFCRFTPSTSEWVDLEPMKNARSWCGAVAVEQRIFVMGGWKGTNEINKVEYYDLFLNRWNSLTRMIHCLGLCDAYYIDGSIFLVGWGKRSCEVEKYDIRHNRWYKVKFKSVGQFEFYNSVSIK